MNLKGRNFINLWDFKSEEIAYLLDHAAKLKKETRKGKVHHNHKNKTLVLIFSKPSLRTRASFEIGAFQLGMNAITLKQDEINLGVRETVADTARVVSRYGDCVMIRTFSHADVEEFAQNSSVPVINGLTDNSHPCQAMADLLTVREHFSVDTRSGANNVFKGLKMAYVGDGNNVANSLMVAAAHVGMEINIVCPKGYEPMESYVNSAKALGGKVNIINDPTQGVKDANVLYTDVWASMGQETEAIERKKIFAPYQLNDELLKNASKNHIVLHCLPAHRGEEITHEVIEKHAKTIFEQAENRLHAQKAIMDVIL